ncbi:AfsR/SARP family transcriptional regulator [Phytomonospora endophytica]|uniref:DNA-binding SARP family transcriptional activator n=1 Tax=Phytomonospora endophytica TaxID=714109 RepID=A0A841FAN3_9ACTN|nr:BTAD domain-containing putative transcriptional regulator [Phytomonospora endophytica]MBB6032345.1 DNA-binding SARP family transcriptional activator [Phytomonospora endophytica]GIG68693.1 hypothetical protein Pen01_49880 [Phytomonospora endophytica]
MRFHLFGSIEVRVGDRPLPVGGPRQRAVLGALLLTPGVVVPTEQLVHRVWDNPPGSAESNVRTYIARLRKVLGERLSTDEHGYRLTVGPGELDAAVFTELADRAERATDSAERARLYAEALAHARDEPLLGVELEAALRSAALRLRERRRAAVFGELDARLAAGEHHEITGRLRALLTGDPADERATELLMLALFRAGRQIEALDAYTAFRARAHPAPGLSALHKRILNQDRTLSLTPGRASVEAHGRLPADLPEFTGRTRLIARARELTGAAPGNAPLILVFSGTAGAGKTALAVHIGHLLAADGAGADGHLHADLNGFTADAAPADPHTVLGALLAVLGVPAARVPGEPASRAALYREHTAGKRLLLLLDDASGAAQVAPLVPAGSGTIVLVTGRRNLLLDGAADLTVEPFTDAEANALLATAVGGERLRAEDAAARRITRHCGGLPLALALAARRLRARPERSLAGLAGGLEHGALDDELSAVFDLSYRALDPGPRRLYRLLGPPACEDVTAETAAAICGRTPAEADGDLEALLDDHLLTQTRPGRYRMHRLLRAHADALCAREDPPATARSAVGRLHTWYLRHALATGDPAWFAAEYANLRALTRAAGPNGHHTFALALPHALLPWLRDHRPADTASLLALARRAALALGDHDGLARSLVELAREHARTGRADIAAGLLDEAAALRHERGDTAGAAEALAAKEELGRDSAAVGGDAR